MGGHGSRQARFGSAGCVILAAMTWQTVLGLTVTALDVYAIVRAVYRGHGVESTLAWIFAILAFPVIGALAYVTLASPSVTRTARRKRRAAGAIRGGLAERRAVARVTTPAAPVLDLAAAATGLPPTSGNAVTLLAEDSQALAELEAVVAAARRSVWVEYYIIRSDATGLRFLDLLAARARAGVEVKLLFDAIGSLGLDSRRLRAIAAAGGRAEAFLPYNPLRRRWAVQLRNHRKIVIVDGEIGFTGGMNIGDEYSGSGLRRRPGRAFHDAHLALRGPAVGDLAQTFAEDWGFATGETLAPPAPPAAVAGATAIVAVVPSGPDQEHNANALVYFSGIAQARTRIYLTSPYFVPDHPTFQALVSAALRGVDVRVLVPDRCDVPVVGSASRSYHPPLVRAGVRLFRYTGATLHAKTMVVDGAWGLVGSANVDVRSFRFNFELGALVADAEFAKRLEQRFDEDLGRSAEVTAADLAGRGIATRLMDGAARLLSPLL